MPWEMQHEPISMATHLAISIGITYGFAFQTSFPFVVIHCKGTLKSMKGYAHETINVALFLMIKIGRAC